MTYSKAMHAMIIDKFTPEGVEFANNFAHYVGLTVSREHWQEIGSPTAMTLLMTPDGYEEQERTKRLEGMVGELMTKLSDAQKEAESWRNKAYEKLPEGEDGPIAVLEDNKFDWEKEDISTEVEMLSTIENDAYELLLGNIGSGKAGLNIQAGSGLQAEAAAEAVKDALARMKLQADNYDAG